MRLCTFFVSGGDPLSSFRRSFFRMGLVVGLVAAPRPCFPKSLMPKRHTMKVPMTLPHDRIHLDLGSDSILAPKSVLDAALHALVTPDEEPESPMTTALFILRETRSGWQSLTKEDQLEQARLYLGSRFNRDSTQMVLLEKGLESRGFVPERGEDPDRSWIFSLVMPALSDHVYWVVVSRDPKHSAYVYGFN